jgi:hypothetical protein
VLYFSETPPTKLPTSTPTFLPPVLDPTLPPGPDMVNPYQLKVGACVLFAHMSPQGRCRRFFAAVSGADDCRQSCCCAAQVYGDVEPPPPNPAKRRRANFVIDFYDEPNGVQ